MSGEPGEAPQGPQDAGDVILDNARILLGSQQDGQKPLVIHSSLDGAVFSDDIIEISRRAEQLLLSSAGAGDVVWWKTASGTTGYFAVEVPYVDEGKGLEGIRNGNGRFLITRREGHPLGEQRGPGHILGSTLGSGLRNGAILKGATLEYELKTGGRDKRYTTTPVTEMGVIKAPSPAQK